MMVILGVYDQQPQPTWQKVSLNSVISWLSTLSKASLLFAVGEMLGQLKWVWFAQKERPMLDLRAFDSASRGAWGSLGLCWTLRVRHFAILGALAMVLALAFDPFSQNLIHTFPKMVVDPSETAQIGNVTVYETYGPSMMGGVNYVDPVFKANVYNSLLNSDQTRPWAIPQYFCTSSNCTWNPVASLEARSLCTNVTSYLTTSCDPFPSNSSYHGVDNCTVSLPKSGTSAWYIPGWPVLTPFTIAAVNDALVYTNGTMYAIQYIAPRTDLLIVQQGVVDNTTQWEATECIIEPIVRSFRATVQQNTYSDITLAEWTNRTLNTSAYVPGWQLNPPWGPDLGVTQSNTTNSTAFVLSSPSDSAILFFFDAIFSGQALRSMTELEFAPLGDADFGVLALYAVSDVLQALGMGNITGCNNILADRLTCVMNNVAAAMTKTFRDSAYIADAATAAMASGDSMTSVTYITVHWQWIALPLFVWLLGAVLVIGTLWKTRRARVPAWKNDLMPLLYLYQDEDVRESERIALHEESGQGNRTVMARLHEEDGRAFLGR
ncbi:hypothetical protein BO71DRAFT_398793 [Aspergillus ellipticus CBS 707.79]|uniref:Uncharacterized protein n=1 Tax=Aspergillus ellipticus CBS 707.79 TaxID=1448320 RepID=A0A319DTM4_9EURO|nr:hypothetical protein BO71DRAFT_398793 [Aspergillus ellipticus CBS 707.79]